MTELESLNFSANEFMVNPKEQSRVLSFFEQLKSLPTGWQKCIEVISLNSVDDQLKFFALQVIEDYLKTQYPALSADHSERLIVRGFVHHWLHQIDGKTKISTSYFLKNKIAQLFCLIFLADFPFKWPNFMQDAFLTSLNYDDPTAVEFYLLVILQIDAEISDREIPKTKEISERNTIIRDNMRVLCVSDMVESWYQLLSRYSFNNMKLCSLTLHNISGFIAWIDINCIANERFMPLIVRNLLRSKLNNMDKNVDNTVIDDLKNENDAEQVEMAASECICSILNKGMDAGLKLQLLQAVDKILYECDVYNVKDTEIETLSRISEIITCTGSILIESYTKALKSPQLITQASDILTALESKLDLALIGLSCPDVTISSMCGELCHQYVVFLKQFSPLNFSQRSFLERLVPVLFARYRFPGDYDHDREVMFAFVNFLTLKKFRRLFKGENEIEFLEYRKELKTIFVNVAILDLTLAVNSSEKIVLATLASATRVHFTEAELALNLLFTLGEVLQSSQGNNVSSDENGLKLKNMVHAMITSGISRLKHPCVSLQYFETVCRYDKTIAAEPSLISDTIASFLDDRGLHHSSPKVRSRSAYLFSKFIRSQKLSVQNHVAQILVHLQDLLQLTPTSTFRLLTSEDQLFLFETVGILIVSGNHSNEDKRNYMRQLLANLVDQFQKALIVLDKTTNEEEKRILIDYINYLMAYASRTSKAFSLQTTMQSCQCEDIFLELMKVFLDAVQPQRTFNASLLNGLRQYLHRMVISLSDQNILPYFPVIIRKFVESMNESRYLQDFLTLIQQAVVKYKADLLNHCKQELSLLYTLIWKVLETPYDLNDEIASRDAVYLKRAYYQLLACQAKNEQLEAWLSLEAEKFQFLLQTLVDGCLMINEPTVQKLSFNTIVKCLENFNKKDQSPNVSIPDWFSSFIYGQILPACFVVPLKVGFDLTDAQSVMVLSEIGSLIKILYQYAGQQFVDFLTQKLWPQANLPAQYAQEFCFNLKSSTETKHFQKYLKSFFANLSNLVKFD